MKPILILLCSVLCAGAQIQTNTFYTNCVPEAKRKVTISGHTLWINGEAIYRPQNSNPALTWWYPGNTNVVTATFTNANCLIQIVDAVGENNAGFSSVSLTNNNPSIPYRFEIYKGTNAPIPTNGTPIPIVVVGVTNYP